MFKLPPGERLNRWKQFRSDLKNHELYDSLVLVNNFWKSCPFTPFYLEFQNPADWPDPWQLVIENYYCDLAKTLGIVYTVYLAGILLPSDTEIRIYYDSTKNHQYHIAYLCQGKYILNLIEDEVVNKEHINQNFKLKHCYTAEDLQLEKY